MEIKLLLEIGSNPGRQKENGVVCAEKFEELALEVGA